MIIHLIGQPGSGKTTLAKELARDIVTNTMLIDGDDIREIFNNKDYSEEGRRRNLTNAYNIARFLDAKGITPILSLVSPFEDLREELKSVADVREIYVKTSQIRGRENFFVKEYQEPQKNYLAVNTDSSIEECIKIIRAYIS